MLSILEPIIPHICWELSDELFERKNFCTLQIDPQALVSESVVMALMVNGKKRGEMSVGVNATKEEILALAHQTIEKWLADVEIKQEIIVPSKLVNFVVKS